MRILIVEDYQQLLRLYEKVLTYAGHEVSKASTVNEARALLKKEHFDICLLDIYLGYSSGIELLNQIPSLKATGTRFIVVSGWDQHREVCEAADINFFLKPISNKELVELVTDEDFQQLREFFNQYDK